jgi:pteridine reductase
MQTMETDVKKGGVDQPVVLITGAGKRAGRVIAERFASDGYCILVHYGSAVAAAQEVVDAIVVAGGSASAYQADLSDPLQLPAMIAVAYERYGRLDVLVNCAAIYFPDHLGDFRLDDLERSWQVNCRAPILLTQAFYIQAKARQQIGVVVNVVDQKVQENFHPDDFSYTVAKTALGKLTDMLAVSARPVLRVNAVYPGLMSVSGDQTAADFACASRAATPLGYLASAHDVAAAIMLLTRPTFNGTDFIVDAGQNLLAVERDVINLYRAPE